MDPYETESHLGAAQRAVRKLMRSGMFTALLLAVLLGGLGTLYYEHTRGNLHKLKQRIGNDRPDTPTYRPGGQDALLITRTRMMKDSAPEFTSVMLLPGRGMNVLQITAFVPGKGEINLLASPAVEDAATQMTGTGEDSGGGASLTMGGAFEAPWAGRLWTNGPGQSATRAKETTSARPREGGLLLAQASTSSDLTALPDGGQAQATFEVGNDPKIWPGRTSVSIAVLLSSKSIDLTMTARNTGETAEAVGLGWAPHFALGSQSGVRLRVPGQMRVATAPDGTPTGALVPVAGTPYDFTSRPGARLNLPVDDCFTGLRQDLLESGPGAELSFPREDYGLRLIALTPVIKAMQVVAPAKGGYIMVSPRFNYPDPFGREWARPSDAGLAVLQPGQSTQWKVRLEIFSPTTDATDR